MRKKIRLEMEELEVESFATTTSAKAGSGTVEGRNYTRDAAIDCQQETISGTMPCLCVSRGNEVSCDSSCNPEMCYCMSAPCPTYGYSCY